MAAEPLSLAERFNLRAKLENYAESEGLSRRELCRRLENKIARDIKTDKEWNAATNWTRFNRFMGNPKKPKDDAIIRRWTPYIDTLPDVPGTAIANSASGRGFSQTIPAWIEVTERGGAVLSLVPALPAPISWIEFDLNTSRLFLVLDAGAYRVEMMVVKTRIGWFLRQKPYMTVVLFEWDRETIIGGGNARLIKTYADETGPYFEKDPPVKDIETYRVFRDIESDEKRKAVAELMGFDRIGTLLSYDMRAKVAVICDKDTKAVVEAHNVSISWTGFPETEMPPGLRLVFDLALEKDGSARAINVRKLIVATAKWLNFWRVKA